MTDPAKIIQSFVESMLTAAEQELQIARESHQVETSYMAHLTASIICSRIAASCMDAKRALKEQTNDSKQPLSSQLLRS